MAWDDRDARKKTERCAATDHQMAERHAGFDRAAQDTTPKYHRPHFAVVGEGSKTAREKYHKGYDQINWSE